MDIERKKERQTASERERERESKQDMPDKLI